MRKIAKYEIVLIIYLSMTLCVCSSCSPSSPYPEVARRAASIAEEYRPYFRSGEYTSNVKQIAEAIAEKTKLNHIEGNLYGVKVRERKIFFAPVDASERGQGNSWKITVSSSPLEIRWQIQQVEWGKKYTYVVYLPDAGGGSILSPVPPVPGCYMAWPKMLGAKLSEPKGDGDDFALKYTDEAIANLEMLYPEIATRLRAQSKRVFRIDYGAMSDQVNPRSLLSRE